MRYKFLLFAAVLLIATPVFATEFLGQLKHGQETTPGQEFSPITVGTGKPTPSVVKSGEPFKITYQAKFFDTVIISEEQMQPDNIVLDKVEVIGLEIKKERVSNNTLGFVNVWDFTYTFRIIQPDKGVKVIPPFNFIWAEKKAGVTVEETKDKEKPREMPTEEVGVNYVSSIVKPPVLDIRDAISFISPVASGAVLRRWAYGVAGILSLLFVIIVFRFFSRSRAWQHQETEREAETETSEDGILNITKPILTPKQARGKFLKELKNMRGDNKIDLVKKIRFLVRSFLLAELHGVIRDSMSETEIYAKLSGINEKQRKQVGWKYEVMLKLALRLKGYQENIDSGECSLNPLEEITELRTAVSRLKFYRRVWYGLRPFHVDEVFVCH